MKVWKLNIKKSILKNEIKQKKINWKGNNKEKKKQSTILMNSALRGGVQ
jgi:hypothetical protein